MSEEAFMTYLRGKKEGYDKGMNDALDTILNLLDYNGVNLDPKEFWTEYKNLVSEGVIKLERNNLS